MSDMVSFVQEAGRRSQSLRFEPDRLVLASADDRSARELSLAYYDTDVRRAVTSVAGRLWRRDGAATRYALLAPKRRGETLEIWPDIQHDRIVAEMAARWKAMRRRVVRIDFGADAAHEMARFEALRQRRVIDAEECAAAIARIAARA